MAEAPQSPESPTVVIQPNLESGEFVEVSELLHADAGDVKANHVAIEQSTVSNVHADQVEIDRTAIKSITAREIRIEQSAAAFLKSDDTALHDSAAGVVTANRIDLFGSTVGIARGDFHATNETGTRVFLHIGGGSGQPRPLLDAQSALTLGAGVGLSVVLLGRVLRRLLGN